MLSTGTSTEINDLTEGRIDFRVYAKSTLPRKIEALLSHKDFQSKLSWIANKLNSSLDEVNNSLQLLESLNLIEWKGREIKSTSKYTDLTEKLKESRSKSSLIDDHRIISHQLLNDVNPNDRFFVINGFTSTDEETFKEYSKRLFELREWFNKESLKSKKTIVAGYTLTGANILNSKDRGEQ